MDARAFKTMIYELKVRAIFVVSIAVLAAALNGQFVLPEEDLKAWQVFTTFAVDFTGSSLMLDTSTFLMDREVREAFRDDSFSDRFALGGVISGVIAFLVRSVQNAKKAYIGSAIMYMFGAFMLFVVSVVATVVIIHGKKLTKMLKLPMA